MRRLRIPGNSRDPSICIALASGAHDAWEAWLDSGDFDRGGAVQGHGADDDAHAMDRWVVLLIRIVSRLRGWRRLCGRCQVIECIVVGFGLWRDHLGHC